MKLKYLKPYPEKIKSQVQKLIENDKLSDYILSKYPEKHSFTTDKALYSYTEELRKTFLKKQTLAKVHYDGKINVMRDALGVHTFISRVQGGKLKTKNEIRIATLFKNMPEEFLKMIVVHELAHFKEKEHNKAFYNFCTYMEPSYHQLELDLRVYLTHMDLMGKLY